MRTTSLKPPPTAFEVLGGQAIFYSGVKTKKQTDTTTGAEVTVYEYDKYTLPIKKTHNLTAQIESDYEGWLNKAIQHEYDTEADKIRAYRDSLLDMADTRYCNPERWDSMTEQERESWRDYKQALRDIPEQKGFPFAVEFPVRPGEGI